MEKSLSFLVYTIKMVDFPASYVSLQECNILHLHPNMHPTPHLVPPPCVVPRDGARGATSPWFFFQMVGNWFLFFLGGNQISIDIYIYIDCLCCFLDVLVFFVGLYFFGVGGGVDFLLFLKVTFYF